jgi:hypothetical protein
VNSKYCNVFTENKRVVSIISTSEFGKVCIFALLHSYVGMLDQFFLLNIGLIYLLKLSANSTEKGVQCGNAHVV